MRPGTSRVTSAGNPDTKHGRTGPGEPNPPNRVFEPYGAVPPGRVGSSPHESLVGRSKTPWPNARFALSHVAADCRQRYIRGRELALALDALTSGVYFPPVLMTPSRYRVPTRAGVSRLTPDTAALDDQQSYRHRLATRSLTPGEAGVRPPSADAAPPRPSQQSRRSPPTRSHP
jgi:hypothetical protein